jgi:hypothetical protein
MVLASTDLDSCHGPGSTYPDNVDHVFEFCRWVLLALRYVVSGGPCAASTRELVDGDGRAGRRSVDSAARAEQWHFGAVYASIPGQRERTRAWPLPGGVPAWQEAAASAPSGWPADPD